MTVHEPSWFKIASERSDVAQVSQIPPADHEPFDWESVLAEPDEGHALADTYPRNDEQPTAPPLTGDAAVQYVTSTLPKPPPARLLPTFGAVVAVALGLAKVALLLVIAHIDLGAAHAGLATDVFVFGVVLLFAGFTMRWTAWDFGLAQVLRRVLYDELGLWLLRVGTAMSFTGAIAVITVEYLA